MKKIGFSGSLDPITNGHMWVIGEARNLAEEVVVFISENPFKKCQFPADQRRKIVEASCLECGWENVSVIVVKGDYTARAAKQYGVDYVLRGIRNTTDFDYENLLQQANVDVISGAKTIFVMPPRDLGSVSSSFIKGLQGPVGWHWHTKKFIPAAAYDAWVKNWLYQEWCQLWNSSNENTTCDEAEFDKRQCWFSNLLQAYTTPNRHYHNLDHLVHGLSELKVYAINNELKERDIRVLNLAFWFHDYIYAGNHDMSDEEASARSFIDSELDSTIAKEVSDLIRATDHFQETSISHPLKAVMLGVDLAILGQERYIYKAYSEAVRKEYQHVPEEIYVERRKQALLHLCDKLVSSTLFDEIYFRDKYANTAISNLSWEIDHLNNNSLVLNS